MASAPLVPLTAFLLEHDYIFGLRHLFNRCVDSCVLDLGSSEGGVVPGADEQHVVDADLSPDFLIEILHHQSVISQNLVLPTEQPDDREDLVRVGRQHHSSCCVVDIHHRVLRWGRLSVGLSKVTLLALKLLFEQWHLPLLDATHVLRVLHEVEVHSLCALFVQVPEVLAE